MTERRPATDAEARALASALRLRILRICVGKPRTNKEIATILGRDPASVLHHTRTLVRTGFLAAQEERRGARGAREIPYLSTGKTASVSTPAQDRSMLDAFLEELALVPTTEAVGTRVGLRLPPERMEEFRTRIYGLLQEYAALPDDPAAPAWSLFMVMHPDPNRP